MDNKFDIEEIDDSSDIEEIIDNENSQSDNKKPKRRLKKKPLIGLVGGIVAVVAIISILLVKGCTGEFTVKFNTNGGSSIESQKVERNGKVSKPATPIRLGHTFLGWYVDNKEYDFDLPVTSNLTLEAKWENNNTADATGVEIDQSEMALLPGDSAPLIATVLPSDAKDQTVKWESSDEKVAVVDEYGNIKAISIGSATITATTNDGGFTATCRVVVSNNVIKVTGISISEDNVSLSIGETKRITTTITPEDSTNKGVIWKSNDENIATVSSTGLITGLKKGSTTISVTTKDGNFEKRIEVSVDEISIKSINIPSSISIQIGKSETLDLTFNPKNVSNKEVKWESSDDKIASVDKNGKVTAKKIGTAVIKVTTEDGKKTATCKVTVTEKAEIDVKLNKNEITLEEGKTEMLQATVTPSGDEYSGVAWSSSDKNVVTVDNGKITATGAGEATITVVSIKDRTKQVTCKVTVTGRPKSYTYTVTEEKSENESGEENIDNSFVNYVVKVYENDTDVTSKVTKIAGVSLRESSSTIIISAADKEKLISSVEIIIDGNTVSATKK